ncbi:MAG: hypothetical protein AAF965_04780 [Pseudomonadota bacterium]
MLKDKRKDLDFEKQKEIMQIIMSDLSKADPDIYYRSTSAIAAGILNYVDTTRTLSAEEKALIRRLGQRDIQIILSMH